MTLATALKPNDPQDPSREKPAPDQKKRPMLLGRIRDRQGYLPINHFL